LKGEKEEYGVVNFFVHFTFIKESIFKEESVARIKENV